MCLFLLLCAASSQTEAQMVKIGNFILIVFEHLDTGAGYIDSDTGLESMSSAEATTKACSQCTVSQTSGGGSSVTVGGGGGAAMGGISSLSGGGIVAVVGHGAAVADAGGHQVDGLRQEVTRLKCDKLDLLRQNVVSVCCATDFFFVKW